MDSYNQRAIKTARKITDFNRHRISKNTHSREQLLPSSNPRGLGVALEYEKMGNQPISGRLTARSEALCLVFERIGVTLGTVIQNVSLKNELSSELIKVIRAPLMERKVIFFREQELDEDEQVQFARRFGELDAFPFGKLGQNPFVLEIVHDEKSPGVENGFHTDVTWLGKPSLGSIAQIITAPR